MKHSVMLLHVKTKEDLCPPPPTLPQNPHSVINVWRLPSLVCQHISYAAWCFSVTCFSNLNLLRAWLTTGIDSLIFFPSFLFGLDNLKRKRISALSCRGWWMQMQCVSDMDPNLTCPFNGGRWADGHTVLPLDSPAGREMNNIYTRVLLFSSILQFKSWRQRKYYLLSRAIIGRNYYWIPCVECLSLFIDDA